MFNPFDEKIEENENDLRLVQRVLEGSRQDLEKLVLRHQAWIYNIAFKMVMDPADAQDVTQEILIKLITKLSTYNAAKASFRTWLYRIVANHVINMKKRKYERIFTRFEDCVASIEKMPDASFEASPENHLLIEELKIKCWTGMLLCLNRKHRLVFILGEIFGVNDAVGSEMFEITKANYRKILSRTRKKMSNFMGQNCGLLNPDNPCHCQRKLNGFVRDGFVESKNIQFYQGQMQKIQDVVRDSMTGVHEICRENDLKLFREHPFYEPPVFKSWFNNLYSESTFKQLIKTELQ